MKHYFLATAILAGLVPTLCAHAEGSPENSLEQVACASGEAMLVRSDSSALLFYAKAGEPVKVFQGWGENQKTETSNGVSTLYRKVQFSARADGSNVGWMADSAIKTESQCPTLGVQSMAPEYATASSAFRFPLKNRPTANFTTGERAFGFARDGGARRHAGNDLYQSINDPIVAVSSGRVLRNLYFFYQGTYALEVQHSNGMVVRYGEVSGRAAVRGGASLASGQTVGYMGKTSCCTPMLHFELYSGRSSGALTTSAAPFQRRSDLLNPASYLSQWEAATFGSQSE